MARKNNTNKITIAAIVIIVILALIIWNPFGGSGKQANEDEQDTQQRGTDEGNKLLNTNEDAENTEDEPEITQKEQDEPEEKENLKTNENLCEDYVLEQGESIDVEGYEITVERIASTNIKLTVNDEETIISQGEYVRKSGIGIEIRTDKILYFEKDDEYNSVELRIGCNKGEDPFDKYVNSKGSRACRELRNTLVEQCNDLFNTDLE